MVWFGNSVARLVLDICSGVVILGFVYCLF